MRDKEKTKEQLVAEIAELSQRITELEALETKRKRTEEIPNDQLEERAEEYREIPLTLGEEAIVSRATTSMGTKGEQARDASLASAEDPWHRCGQDERPRALRECDSCTEGDFHELVGYTQM